MTDEQEKATNLREIGGIPCEGVLQDPMPSGRRKVTVYGVENEDSWRITEFVCGKLDWQSQLSSNAAAIAAQAAEIERLTKEAVANEAAIACAEGIHRQMEAELAALRSQLEEQRAALNCGMLFISNKIRVEYSHVAGGWKSEIGTHQDPIEFGVFESPIEALRAANWLTPHAEIEST